MLVNVNGHVVCAIDIEPKEAFRILCKTLEMDFVLDEDTNYFVVKDNFGDSEVCCTRDGHDETIDDRGDLFIALRNVAEELFPNIGFRGMTYEYVKREW